MNYLIRNIDRLLWSRVRARAVLEGKSVREVILDALRLYAGVEEEEEE